MMYCIELIIDSCPQVESDMADFEKSVAAMEADMDQRMAPLKPGLPAWALPQNQHKNWPKITSEDMSSSSSSGSGGLLGADKVTCSGDKWEVAMDVTSFAPDSLKVAVAGDLVTVSGAQESSSAAGDSVSRTCQSFSRSYTLPSGCDPDSVASNLTSSGQLLVTCPRPYYLQGPSAKALKM